MVRHACHSLAIPCRAKHAFLLKELDLPAPNWSSLTKKHCLPLPASFLKGLCLPPLHFI